MYMEHGLDLELDKLNQITLNVLRYDENIEDIVDCRIRNLHSGMQEYSGYVMGTLATSDTETNLRILPICAKVDDRFHITKSKDVFDKHYMRLSKMVKQTHKYNIFVKELWGKIHELILDIDKCEPCGSHWENIEYGITHSSSGLSNTARTLACLLMDIYGEYIYSSLYMGTSAFEKYFPDLVKYSNSTLLYDNVRLLFMSEDVEECWSKCTLITTGERVVSSQQLHQEMKMFWEPHLEENIYV